MKQYWESHSPEETRSIACRLGEQVKPGDIICLEGDLGVGKTVFTQGFAQGMGIKNRVTSPTFTIVQEYRDGRLPLFHFDVYRIGDISEMEEIGYEEYFEGEGVCLIEWAEKISLLIPQDAAYIHISKDLEKGFDYRSISLEKRKGTDYENFRD